MVKVAWCKICGGVFEATVAGELCKEKLLCRSDQWRMCDTVGDILPFPTNSFLCYENPDLMWRECSAQEHDKDLNTQNKYY